MVTSEELLQEFARNRSEEAFRQIVERHLDMVYATATRLLAGDSHFARDVAQEVFRDLALKAGRIPRGTHLSGWLYQHARFTAMKMIRGNQRRAAREQGASEQRTEANTSALSERLDSALEKLSALDRSAIILRFLEAREFSEVGRVLGVSEDAAQKRVSRALDKLRAILARRGLELTATGLAAGLTAQNQGAPAGLASFLTRHAVEHIYLTPMTSTLFANIKVKLAIALIGAAAAGTPLLLSWQKAARLAEENQRAAATISGLRDEIEALKQANPAEELARLRRDNAELHRLRAEISAMRDLLRGLEKANADLAIVAEAEARKQSAPAQVRIDARYAEMPPAVLAELSALGISVPADSTSATVLKPEQTRELTDLLEKREGVDLLSAPSVTTVDRRPARISVEDNVMLEGQAFPVGTVLDVTPTVEADQKTTWLVLAATYTEFLGDSDRDKLPRFRVRQAVSTGRIHATETLLLQALSSAPTDEAPRKIIVLVSSAVINPDGTRRY